MPLVSYNVPSRTAVEIAPETVARLRRGFANFVGVKETTKDFEHYSQVLHVADRDTPIWCISTDRVRPPLVEPGDAAQAKILKLLADGAPLPDDTIAKALA